MSTGNSYVLYILEKIYKIFILAEDGDKGGEMAKLWESSIRQALMPVVHVTGPQGSVSSVKASGEASSDKPSNSTSGTAAANVAGSTKAAAETDNR